MRGSRSWSKHSRLRNRFRLVAVVVSLAILAMSVSLGPTGATAQTPQTDIPPIQRGNATKLDSVLVDLVSRLGRESVPGIASRAPTARGPQVGVTIRTRDAERLLADLLSGGVAPANVGTDSVEAYVRPDQLPWLEQLSAVDAVGAILPPKTTVLGQGATNLNAPNWNSFGFTGSGIKVGIIDVGFQSYGSLIGTELPTPAGLRCYTAVGSFTANLADCQASTVHGTAVAETIIDVAPNVSLYLANPISSLDLMNTVSWMASQGVQVINQSLQWFWEGPGDGTTIYASSPLKAVDAAAAAGIVWVNSAGNANLDTWSGAWNDPDSDQWLDFTSGVEMDTITLSAGQQVIIQARWEDTWGLAARDLDLGLYTSSDVLVASSATSQSGQAGNIPWEALSYTAAASDTYRIRLRRFSGTAPSWVQVQDFGGGHSLSIATSGRTITNPAESSQSSLLAVGAAKWSTTSVIEPYSSQGPTRDGRTKPDIVASDCADTVTYGVAGFCGTSQASPYVAGMAALLRQGFPGDSAAQAASRLRTYTSPRGAPIPNNTWGAGFATLPTIAGKLTFTRQPSSGSAGVVLSTQPRVEIQNAAGATNTNDNSTQVTLTVLGGGSPSISCTGGATKTVVSGVADFTGCSVSPSGANYTLIAAPSCFCTTAQSASFSIGAGGNRLVFSSQPSNGIIDSALLGQPVVGVTDANGTIDTTDNSTAITLSLAPAPLPLQSQTAALEPAQVAQMAGQPVELRWTGIDAASFVPPPTPVSFGPTTPSAVTATFQVTYHGFSAQAQSAFQGAVDVWSQLITATVPITIDASWTDLGGPSGGGTILGSAGPHTVFSGFTGAPTPSTWYPVALANQLALTDLDPTSFDIGASFNSNGAVSWYYGTDGAPGPGQIDLMSVVLHEIGHGLGFTGTFQVSSGVGGWGLGQQGFPTSYDRNVVNGSDQSLVSSFTNPSSALGSQLTSTNLFFQGSHAIAANGGTKPKLYAPAVWSSGSSIAHLDEATFPAGDLNSLMTPSLNSAEAVHNPGPVALGVLQDLGWAMANLPSLTCTGGLTKTVAAGLAAFTGCTVHGTGSFVLHASSSPTRTPVDSSALVVTGAPDHLVFSAQPTSGSAGIALAPQPTVTVKDAFGATVLADQSSVITLALNAPTSGGPGVLSCSAGLAKTVSSGVAAFAGCSIDTPGIAYSIHAASGVLEPTDTGTFSLFGIPAKLVFVQQPGSALSSVPLSSQPIVAVEDAAGNVITSDNSTVVTLALSNPNYAWVCTNTVSRTTVNGLATFSGCFVGIFGEATFTLHATSNPPLTSADSSPFTVYGGKGANWYFAEGFTGLGWSTELHLLNDNLEAATVNVTYLLDGGAPVTRTLSIQPQSVRVLDASNLAEGPGPDVAFGVKIAASIPIVAEEQMFAGASGDFAHGTQGATQLLSAWYFAEGFTQFGWQTFVLVANPSANDASVTITYQIQGGAPVQKTVSVPAGTRHTFLGHVDVPDQAFSVQVTSTVPLVAEMSMYDPARGIAHRAIGVGAGASSWSLGEGFTGAGWETYISVGNIYIQDLQVTATYLIDGEPPVSRTINVPAHSRGTFIAQSLETGVGPGKAFGVLVTSPNGPIVVQEVLIDPSNGASRANSTMASQADARWSFSGGSTMPGNVTFLTVANQSLATATVTATYYFDDGTAPIMQSLNVSGSSRGTFVSTSLPSGKRFGVVLNSNVAVVAQEAVYDEPKVRAYSAGGMAGP